MAHFWLMERGGRPASLEAWEAAHQSKPAGLIQLVPSGACSGEAYAERRHIPSPAIPHPTLCRLCHYVALMVWLNHDEYIVYW